MKIEIDTSCYRTCPFIPQREEMLRNWQVFEQNVADMPDQEIAQEGTFICAGARAWAIGPLILHHSCQGDPRAPEMRSGSSETQG